MRVLIATVLLLVGIGIAALLLGWFPMPTAVHDHEMDRSLTADAEKAAQDRDVFQQLAEVTFKAMALNLAELKVKAKDGRAVKRDRMKMAVDALISKTEAAHELFGPPKAATTPEQWHALKMRLGVSLKELEAGFEQVFSRFMSESTLLDKALQATRSAI